MQPNTHFKNLRKRLGLSQIELASKIGVSQGTITDIERGRIGISKRVAQKLQKEFTLKSGEIYGDNENIGIDKIKGKNSGVTQEENKKEEKEVLDKAFWDSINSTYPHLYWEEKNRKLSGIYERRLQDDVEKNHTQLIELFDELNEIMNLEFVILSLNSKYFNKIQLQLHSSLKYISDDKIDYEKYKKDFLQELETLSTIQPAISKFARAISTFYSEIKDFDTENIIEGYFGADASKASQ